MNLGSLGNMMGAVPGGFQQGQIANNQIDQQQMALVDQKAKQVGMEAYFRALQGMMGGGGQSPQPPMPGQPSMPQQGGAPQMSPQAMPGPQMGSPAPMAMQPSGQPMRGADGGMLPPDMGMQSAPASGVQPGGSPGGGPGLPPTAAPGGQQEMTWRTIAQQLKQQNPGVDDLALAHAVDKFMPLMNQQAQAEWRNIRSDVMLEIAKVRGTSQVAAADSRAAGTVAAAETRADATTTAATTRADATVTAAETRAAEQRLAREQRDSHFQQRETRLQEGLKLRTDATWMRLDQQRQALEQRVRQGDRKQAVTELRAVIDAQHKLAMEKIQATGINSAMKPKDREQFIKDQNEHYRAEIEKLRGLATQRGNTTDDGPIISKTVEDKPVTAPAPKPKPAAKAAPAAPATSATAVPVPADFASDPDGTTYQKDGKTWVKRGDQLVLENGG